MTGFETLQKYLAINSMTTHNNFLQYYQCAVKLDDLDGKLIASEEDDKVLTLSINSGTLELNANKAIILAD